MDLFEAIHGRRSIRRYTAEPLAPDALETLLDAARWAPNAGNWNAWRFVVVTSPVQKQLLLKFTPGVDDVPAAVIVICIEPKQKQVKEAARLVYVADAAIAAENMALAAHGLGLGSCIVVSFAEAALRAVLKLPEAVFPCMLLTVGHPAEAPPPPPRRPLAEIAFTDEYGQEWRP
ncbi:MAG: nitroreductase family protein [Anaerolineae bacterium]|jgi:nitroreductase